MENLNEAIITTRFVLENNSVIVSVYKDNLGEWQFFGKEDNISEEDARVISLSEILQIDPTLKVLLEINAGSRAYRANKEDNWKVEKYEE
ncbi:hypothetical protein CRN76_00470 [Chryseobacterium indologenes]|uniref:hypothetical protein n=1 Tax=Chryseobacterium indologenes TaxID=253 RepID=UPI000BFB9AC2|nr:hypothetical protein [Chryseobacterium indologenes]ATN04015.1 hypothetical protein CRN76_00470 [Chryseobacterium indologenes]AYY83321.1 hypothetical protein EGX91_01435 [Chryseobacterium indologenes]QIX80230.1 hypothetical protein FOB56_02820 [Chryseobacterium indologenes]UDQ53881.1 hypothetical protein LJF28_21095 [Chryseobacterium indologenes]